MSYNLTREELNEMRDWSGKAEQLVRLGMMPVAKLPYIKRALKLVAQDAFLPLIVRKPFYEFIEELLELGLGEAGIYRLIRNKVAQNRNDSVTNRYMPEETNMAELEEGKTKGHKGRGERPWWRQEFRSKRATTKGEHGGYPIASPFTKKRTHKAERKIAKQEIVKGQVDEGLIKKQNKQAKRDLQGKDDESVRASRAGNWVGGTDLGTRSRLHKLLNFAKYYPPKKVEEEVGKVPQQPKWLKGKKLARPNPYEDEGSVRNKTKTGDMARTLSHDVEIHEDCTDIKSGTVKKQPHWLKGGKLTHPNPYGDEESKHNKTKSKEIADKANSEVKVTEGRDNQYRYDMATGKHIKRTKKESVQAKKDFIEALWKKKEDGLKPKSEGFIRNMIDTMRAAHTPLAGKKKIEPTHRKVEIGTRGGVKSAQDFKVAPRERKTTGSFRAIKDEFLPEEGRRASDNQSPESKKADLLWKKTNPTDRLSASTKAHRDFDGHPSTSPQPIKPKEDKPMPKGKAVQLRLDMGMILSGNLLDEDVNYRKTPQGMLQTLASMVKIKKRHGGKVSVNDRKIASKARNELRRRKYFGTGSSITASFDPEILDLADALAEEGVFLTDEQLDELQEKSMEEIVELHKDTYHRYIAHALADRDDHMMNFAVHSMAGRNKQASHSRNMIQKRTKGVSHAINRLHSPVTNTVHSKPKKVKHSKTTWFKSVEDAADVSDVNPRARVRKEDFETRFNKALELFEIKSISELDEEMTKLFMAFVQEEIGDDDPRKRNYVDKVAKKIHDKNVSKDTTDPDRLRYQKEMEKRKAKEGSPEAEKALDDVKAIIDAERKKPLKKKIKSGE